VKRLRFHQPCWLKEYSQGLLKQNEKTRLSASAEPPAPKDVISTKMALNKGMLYTERPSISSWILISLILWWSIGISIVMISLTYLLILSFLVVIIGLLLIFGVIWPILFVFKGGREQ
jgi:hypothetical protein